MYKGNNSDVIGHLAPAIDYRKIMYQETGENVLLLIFHLFPICEVIG